MNNKKIFKNITWKEMTNSRKSDMYIILNTVIRLPVIPQVKSIIATIAIQNFVNNFCNILPKSLINLLLISEES